MSLTFQLITLRTSVAMPTYMMNIYAKFHSNASTKYGDIASRETDVNGQRTDGQKTDGETDRRPENIMLSA